MISLEPTRFTDKWAVHTERNRLEARQNSKCPQEISREAHSKWWSKNHWAIWMIVDKHAAVGYIHFEEIELDWENISVLIYHKKRGNRYAKKAIQTMISYQPNINYIAEVLPHNTTAHHLFQEVGFIQYAPGLYIHRAESANWSFG